MESSFLKTRHATLLLRIPVIVSSAMNPEDAVTGLGEITTGLHEAGKSTPPPHAGSGAKSTFSSREAQQFQQVSCCPWPTSAPADGQHVSPQPLAGRHPPSQRGRRRTLDRVGSCELLPRDGKEKTNNNPNSATNDPAFRLSHAAPGQMGADVHNTAGNARRTRLKHLL